MQPAGASEQTRTGLGRCQGTDTGEDERATGRNSRRTELGGGRDTGAFDDDVEAVEHPR